MRSFIIMYSLTANFRMNKSRRMRWAGHAACTRKERHIEF